MDVARLKLYPTVTDDERLTPDEYKVTRLLDRCVRHGHRWYLVKWFGFNKKSENTWEPERALRVRCGSLIDEFEEALASGAHTPSDSKPSAQARTPASSPANAPSARQPKAAPESSSLDRDLAEVDPGPLPNPLPTAARRRGKAWEYRLEYLDRAGACKERWFPETRFDSQTSIDVLPGLRDAAEQMQARAAVVFPSIPRYRFGQLIADSTVVPPRCGAVAASVVAAAPCVADLHSGLRFAGSQKSRDALRLSTVATHVVAKMAFVKAVPGRRWEVACYQQSDEPPCLDLYGGKAQADDLSVAQSLWRELHQQLHISEELSELIACALRADPCGSVALQRLPTGAHHEIHVWAVQIPPSMAIEPCNSTVDGKVADPVMAQASSHEWCSLEDLLINFDSVSERVAYAGAVRGAVSRLI